MYQDVNGCAATGFTMSHGGHTAARYIAIAHGVALPEDFMRFSQQMSDQDVVAACEVLFGARFNQNAITYVDQGVYAKRGEETAISDAIRRSNQPTSPPVNQTTTPSFVGFPSGYPLSACNCWGMPPSVPGNAPQCKSGMVIPRACTGGVCQGGLLPWQSICY